MFFPRHLFVWSAVVCVSAMAWGEPGQYPRPAPQRSVNQNRPSGAPKAADRFTSRQEADADEKQGNSSSPPDLRGVWRGQITGMPGGGPGGGGMGGRGPQGGRGGRPGGAGGQRQMEIELTIDAQKITGREMGRQGGGRDLGVGTYELTGSRTSGNFDAEGTEGREEGRTFLGIYEYKNGELKWAVSNRRFRPKGFTPQGGSYVLTLRRQKEQKN